MSESKTTCSVCGGSGWEQMQGDIDTLLACNACKVTSAPFGLGPLPSSEFKFDFAEFWIEVSKPIPLLCHGKDDRDNNGACSGKLITCTYVSPGDVIPTIRQIEWCDHCRALAKYHKYIVDEVVSMA